LDEENTTRTTSSSSLADQQMVVLDASVWISRTIVTDRNHTASRLWVARHLQAKKVFVVPTLFELEVADAISRVTKDPILARKQVAQLRRLNTRGVIRFVPLLGDLMQNATSLSIDFGLRAADAIYAALAQRLGVDLVTFDAELLSLPVSTLKTIKP
jgi:predicted nucleic acid-binding protein